MIILGIETSCDETSIAILDVKNKKINLIGHTTFSQIKTHKKYGGVIPEIAARLHVPKILPVLNKTLSQANITPAKIDAIAVTAGPGLMTSLMVGIHTARILSYIWKKPLIKVNHMEGHVVSALLTHPMKDIKFPALCLTVSGGHTELVLIKKWGDYTIIGRTRDDAVGEAFDKVAKLLELPYPGGPALSKIAINAKNPTIFPTPMINSPDYDFSFSGLKTAVRYHIETIKKNKPTLSTEEITDCAAGFQKAAVDVLISKTKRAASEYKTKTILIGGGVAANALLRERMPEILKEVPIIKNICIPAFEFCTDNAAMIAVAGYFQAKQKKFTTPEKIKPNPIWEIGEK